MHNIIQTLPIPKERFPPKRKKQQMPQSDYDACHIHRNSAFSAMSQIKPYLKKHGCTDTEIWEGIKKKANVDSRSKFTPKNWAVVSAKLQAIVRNPQLVIPLIAEYKETP